MQAGKPRGAMADFIFRDATREIANAEMKSGEGSSGESLSYMRFTGSTSMITLHFLAYFSSTACLPCKASWRMASRF